jgi:hypothetical protein
MTIRIRILLRPLYRRLFVLLVFCSSVLLRAQDHQSEAPEISGTWSDACPCSIPCPCWHKHKSSARVCVNFHVFRIRQGTYDGVSLAESVFVLEGLPRIPGQAPATHTLFVNSADPRKASAIESVVRRFGLAPPRVSRTVIEYHGTDKTEELLIPGVLRYEVSFEVQRPLSDEVSANLYPWLSSPRQGTVKSVVYSAPGEETVTYSNSNALSAAFRIPTPEP